MEALEAAQPHVWHVAHTLIARNETNNSTSAATATAERPPVYKAVGLSLAVASGIFIGISFVLKKVGLLRANAKYNEEAGEGYGYLKNAHWWGGMVLMIIGEICNFVAYAFVDAILVTPLGALSVVVTTILSAIFLKERLSFVGKVGCFNCIIGSIVIVLNAPEQSAVSDIQQMKDYVVSPGFLSYAAVVIVGCTIVAFWAGPRYGKKSMMVYLTICSFIGGLSVVATQGLGSAVVAQAGGQAQFNQWFLYVLLVFVIATLVTEIIYLNKALNLFNAALVTPTYYVYFTSTTIITSAILFRGFKGTPVTIATVIMGFLVICTGVILLQMSKSAKDVPDAAVFKGDLDQIREIGEQEQPETEPKADAIRGTAALIRRISVSRQKMEQEEARRLRHDTLKDQLEPLRENEVVEWDGLRRRKTVVGDNPIASPIARRRSVHPPLGMSHFPNPEAEEADETPGFFESLRNRAQSAIHPGKLPQYSTNAAMAVSSPVHPMALTDIRIHPAKTDSPIVPGGPGSFEEAQAHIFGTPLNVRSEQPSPRSKPLPAKPPPSPGSATLIPPAQEARRQFSFTNFLRPSSRTTDVPERPSSRPGMTSRSASHEQRKAAKTATEEERLGLVKGDSLPFLERDSPRSPERPPTHPSDPPAYRSRSSSTASDFCHFQAASPPRRSPSDSDEDDGWQMTSPPSNPRSRSPPRATPAQTPFPPSSRRRPSPPRMFPPPPAITRTTTPSLTPSSDEWHGRTPRQGDQLGGETTPERAVPRPFPPLSTSPRRNYQRHSRTSTETGLLQDDFEDLQAPASQTAGLDHGTDLAAFSAQMQSPAAYEGVQKKFEEQSKREREERRARSAGRRQSWRPGPARESENGGDDHGGGGSGIGRSFV